ncbi:MAG: mandelate racemase/muconate lactonizing enzyme family protein [Acidobacteriaceae bacterium]|nr:mandelate racemase/muconate lactonizing enzyme family protein [Acidobacteriaceae bacterium]
MTRRRVLKAAAAGPVAMLADTPASDRPCGSSKPIKITNVEAVHLEKPLKERFWMANSPIGGYEPKASRLIVTIHTDAGISGQGEGAGSGAGILRKGFADLLTGEDPFMVGKIWEKMFAVTYGREPSSRGWQQNEVIAAMAPIDAALYDIMAKAAGLPVYKFLGGYRDTVPVYVTGGYYREGKGISELIKEVRSYIDQGFNAIKLKVGGISGGFSVEDDYERVKAVRQEVGPKVKLMLDANQGWDVPTAIRASNKMYDLDITWLEEPLHWYDDVEPLKQVKLNTRIPLASGEHELTRWGARRLMETGAIDVMQFDCNAHAGITEWRKIAGMASMCFIRMAPHHEPVLHGHLLASIPNGYILESFANPDRDPLWFELYDRKPRIEKSVLYLDNTPGFGVEFNQNAVTKYGTKVL